MEHCKRLEENESFRDWLLNAFEVGPSGEILGGAGGV